ncbi:MAG: hypothetical protein ACRD12_01065 [Acidimicrobiales bacterium]
MRDDEEVATWTLHGCARPDLAMVDGLARLALLAQRLGLTMWLREVDGDLSGLLRLIGLAGCLLGGEARGQPEEGEQAGVEKVVVADNPVA